MKRTFENLPVEKKERILQACIHEFGEHGYDGSSVDRVIKRAGISKGGLYEYSKQVSLTSLLVKNIYFSL